MAYYRAVEQIFGWIQRHQIDQVVDFEPLPVAAHIEALQGQVAKPTVRQHLAAVRMCFDWLVTRGVPTVNPTHAMRGPKQVVKRGKPPMLTIVRARGLIEFASSTLVGWHDPAEGALAHTWLAALKVPTGAAARSRGATASLSAGEPLRDRDDRPVPPADLCQPDQREGPRTLRALFAPYLPNRNGPIRALPSRPTSRALRDILAHASRQSFKQVPTNQEFIHNETIRL